MPDGRTTDTHRLMYTRDEVDKRDAEIREEAKQARENARKNREDIDRILRILEPPNGRGLEERMIAYTDKVFNDAERDYTQIGLNATTLIATHGADLKETRKEVAGLSLTIAKWGGAIAALLFAGTIAEAVILHFWK